MNFAKMDGDFETWRTCARKFLHQGVTPQEIQWLDLATPESSLFEDKIEVFSPPTQKSKQSVSAPRVPQEFIELSQIVACHRSTRRWSLLYEVLWRLCHGEPKLLSIVVDSQVAELLLMKKAVRRDLHKMKAFVRFQEVSRENENIFTAWYEPDHLIVERGAAFFVRRFGNISWTILTPDRCAAWNMKTKTLSFFHGISKRKAQDLLQADQVEELWKLYYTNIFNPARIKLKAMKKEMPIHFWKNLPEASLISDLVREAGQKVKNFKESKNLRKGKTS